MARMNWDKARIEQRRATLNRHRDDASETFRLSEEISSAKMRYFDLVDSEGACELALLRARETLSDASIKASPRQWRQVLDDIDNLEYELDECRSQLADTKRTIVALKHARDVERGVPGMSKSAPSETVAQDSSQPIEELIEVTLSPRLLQRISNIAANDVLGHEVSANRSVYILQVRRLRGSGDYVFYVGETGHEVERRAQQHIDLTKLAARMFRNGNFEVTWTRHDLTSELPKFRTQRAARKVEGLIAEFLSRRGMPAYSDQLKRD